MHIQHAYMKLAHEKASQQHDLVVELQVRSQHTCVQVPSNESKDQIASAVADASMTRAQTHMHTHTHTHGGGAHVAARHIWR